MPFRKFHFRAGFISCIPIEVKNICDIMPIWIASSGNVPGPRNVKIMPFQQPLCCTWLPSVLPPEARILDPPRWTELGSLL